MAKFNEYPAKTIPKDADKFMLYSAEDSANKLIDYDKLADAVLDKLTSKQFTLDQGTKTLLSALNELNSNWLRFARINYPSDNDALKKLDMPSLIFNQGQALPYIFVFTDTQGDSGLAGGISLVYGLMYEMDNYGVQIAVHYSGTIRKRNKDNNVWNKWTVIH